MNSVQPVIILSENQRAQFGMLADVLIPASDGMPSATQVGVHTTYIDDALRLRSDLYPAFLAALDALDRLGAPLDSLISLQSSDPASFDALGVLTAGSYYMDDRVRELIGYPGQEERALVDDTDSYLDMLERVVDHGPTFRSIPGDGEHQR